MARPEKVAVVDEVREELSDNPATLLTEYRGLSVGDMAELRAALREAGARYVVVKNTLARIAARDAGFEALEELFTGPTALTYCDDDPVRPAKALRRFAKEHPDLVVKGGILEGRVVDADTAEKLADLETREELLQRFARLVYGALANTASLMQAPIRDMARLVAALEDQVRDSSGAAEVSPDDDEDALGEPPDEAAAAEEPATPTDEEPDADGSSADESTVEGDGSEDAEAVDAAADTAADAVEAADETAGEAAESVTETVDEPTDDDGDDSDDEEEDAEA